MNIDELQKRFNELRGKKWRTVSGHVKAEFIGFILGSSYPFSIQLENGKVHAINLDLFSFTDSLSPYIEEVTPYADWPIDAKIWVWNGNESKRKGYFAGISHNGKVMAWVGGSTSWSECNKCEWDHAELAED